ncbi:unnamed protein product [Protopolystoma xenopodis]|uniref:Protein Wnt n=1 Tax=Protopolystoma xenopodis TaxID=117903 RepID=A0A448WVF3_9PLAT|nr:unnamed protein product [Protopolystoma xenopodis]
MKHCGRTREQAIVYTLASASFIFEVARRCASNKLVHCQCGLDEWTDMPASSGAQLSLEPGDEEYKTPNGRLLDARYLLSTPGGESTLRQRMQHQPAASLVYTGLGATRRLSTTGRRSARHADWTSSESESRLDASSADAWEDETEERAGMEADGDASAAWSQVGRSRDAATGRYFDEPPISRAWPPAGGRRTQTPASLQRSSGNIAANFLSGWLNDNAMQII